MTRTLFFHEYPHKRVPFKDVKVDFSGSLDATMPKLKGKPSFAIGEAPIRSFEMATPDELSWVFQFIHQCQNVPVLIVTLPYSFLTGDGKGYVLEIEGYAFDEFGFRSQLTKVRWNQFGSCVEGATCFLILYKDPMTFPKSMVTTETTVTDYFPDIITHAPKYVENIVFTSGSGSYNGFIKSHMSAFPAIDLWNGTLLLCERKSGMTLETSRLTYEEMSTIFGAEIEGLSDLPLLSKTIPTVVYDTFIKTFLIDCN